MEWKPKKGFTCLIGTTPTKRRYYILGQKRIIKPPIKNLTSTKSYKTN